MTENNSLSQLFIKKIFILISAYRNLFLIHEIFKNYRLMIIKMV